MNHPSTFILPTEGEIQQRRLRGSIRKQAIFETINLLVSGYTKKGQIEARVLELAFFLKCPQLKIASQKQLAKKLRLSKQRISVAIDSYGHRVEAICAK